MYESNVDNKYIQMFCRLKKLLLYKDTYLSDLKIFVKPKNICNHLKSI